MATTNISLKAGDSLAGKQHEEVEERVFILDCKVGPHVTQKFFLHRGDLKSAIDRASSYCDTMRYRFIHCKPFLSDFEADMRRIQGIE